MNLKKRLQLLGLAVVVVFLTLASGKVGQVAASSFTQVAPFQVPSPNLFPVAPFGSLIDDQSLDGMIGPEWFDAIFVFEGIELVTDDSLNRFPATVYLKHDGEFMHIAMVVEIGMDLEVLEAFVVFDTNGNGILFDRGDDLANLVLEESNGEPVWSGVDFLYITDLEFAPDPDFGGTEDVIAAATFIDGFLTAEFKRPLDSGDRFGNDPELAPGDEMLISIGFYGIGSELEARIPLIFNIQVFLAAYVDARVYLDAKALIEMPGAKPFIEKGVKVSSGFGPILYEEFFVVKKAPIAGTTKIENVKVNIVKVDVYKKKKQKWAELEKRLGYDVDGDGKPDLIDFQGRKVSISEPTKTRITVKGGRDAAISGTLAAVPAGSVIKVTDPGGNSAYFRARHFGDFQQGLGKLNIAPGSNIKVDVFTNITFKFAPGVKQPIRYKKTSLLIKAR